jgi:AcrR family transcriptional regulator
MNAPPCAATTYALRNILKQQNAPSPGLVLSLKPAGPFFLIRPKKSLDLGKKLPISIAWRTHVRYTCNGCQDEIFEEFVMPRLSKARKALLNTMMKETIFEAATTVLCEHGVNGTTMNRVAEAANLAKSSLYDYFENKDDLLQFFNARLVEPCFQAIEEISNTDLPAPQKLERILRTAWEYSVKDKGLIRLLVGADQSDQIRKNTRPRLLKLLTAIFEQGIREGSFRPHNSAHTGRMFLGCVSELFELQADDAPSAEVNDYVEVLIDTVLNGFSIHAQKE